MKLDIPWLESVSMYTADRFPVSDAFQWPRLKEKFVDYYIHRGKRVKDSKR